MSMSIDEAIEVLGGLVSEAGGEGDDALDVIKDAVTALPIGCFGMKVSSYVVYGNGTRQLTLKPNIASSEERER